MSWEFPSITLVCLGLSGLGWFLLRCRDTIRPSCSHALAAAAAATAASILLHSRRPLLPWQHLDLSSLALSLAAASPARQLDMVLALGAVAWSVFPFLEPYSPSRFSLSPLCPLTNCSFISI